MKQFNYPAMESWNEILKRPSIDHSSLVATVQQVMRNVKQEGDKAIRKYTEEFDGINLESFLVNAEEITAAESLLNVELKKAIRQAAANIHLFHQQQMKVEPMVETMPGIQCWRKSIGIEKVGLYIPGGSAPLFSTILMLGIPAKIAACKEVILCSPPDKNGLLHPAILFAAQVVGISKIYKIGGVQAIAAMAYGTSTVPKVYKIFGPGNQYVTCAKQLLQQEGVAIDMPAGPSEVCVLADDSANPAFIAADLLSQAEHGSDSQVVLITNSETILENVKKEIALQLPKLSRNTLAAKALENSCFILTHTLQEAIDMANAYAAEHLIIACKNEDSIAEKITNAGSIFLGNYSPESAGDYASGTNHTLPTNGYARAYSGVSVDSFVKKVTFQKISERGLQNIGQTVIQMAEAEGLTAHANAVAIRLAFMEQNS